MFQRNYMFFLATLCLLWGASDHGWCQLRTAHTYAFGDSLTDNDLLFLLFGTSPEIYGADPFEAVFLKASKPTDRLNNEALLGSTTADILEQVKDYRQRACSGETARATLASLQGGGNDLLDIENDSFNLFLLASAAPGDDPLVDQIVTQARQNLIRSFLILRRTSRAQILIWTAPDITRTPYVLSFGFTSEQLDHIRAHVRRLNRGLRLLDWLPRVAVVDTETLLTDLALNPPVIMDVPIQPAPAFGFASAQFADPIHPTAVLNAIVANEMIDELNWEFRDRIPRYSELELARLAGLIP